MQKTFLTKILLTKRLSLRSIHVGGEFISECVGLSYMFSLIHGLKKKTKGWFRDGCVVCALVLGTYATCALAVPPANPYLLSIDKIPQEDSKTFFEEQFSGFQFIEKWTDAWSAEIIVPSMSMPASLDEVKTYFQDAKNNAKEAQKSAECVVTPALEIAKAIALYKTALYASQQYSYDLNLANDAANAIRNARDAIAKNFNTYTLFLKQILEAETAEIQQQHLLVCSGSIDILSIRSTAEKLQNLRTLLAGVQNAFNCANKLFNDTLSPFGYAVDSNNKLRTREPLGSAENLMQFFNDKCRIFVDNVTKATLVRLENPTVQTDYLSKEWAARLREADTVVQMLLSHGILDVNWQQQYPPLAAAMHAVTYAIERFELLNPNASQDALLLRQSFNLGGVTSVSSLEKLVEQYANVCRRLELAKAITATLKPENTKLAQNMTGVEEALHSTATIIKKYISSKSTDEWQSLPAETKRRFVDVLAALDQPDVYSTQLQEQLNKVIIDDAQAQNIADLLTAATRYAERGDLITAVALDKRAQAVFKVLPNNIRATIEKTLNTVLVSTNDAISKAYEKHLWTYLPQPQLSDSDKVEDSIATIIKLHQNASIAQALHKVAQNDGYCTRSEILKDAVQRQLNEVEVLKTKVTEQAKCTMERALNAYDIAIKEPKVDLQKTFNIYFEIYRQCWAPLEAHSDIFPALPQCTWLGAIFPKVTTPESPQNKEALSLSKEPLTEDKPQAVQTQPNDGILPEAPDNKETLNEEIPRPDADEQLVRDAVQTLQ